MPSAQQVEIEKPSGRPAVGDLQSLLREIHGSNQRNLESLHGRGKVLFAEGEPARGVYILCSGRASVSICSSEGRVLILRIAQPGDVLGLNAVLRNSSYDMTVKTLEPCRTSFIPRADLIELLENSEAGPHTVIQLLSRELAELTDRTLLLQQTARARLTKLLLQWSKQPSQNTSRTGVIDKVVTQEEIAQMIGSARETVSRMLAALCRQGIIRITSESILIDDFAALEEMAKG